MVPVSLFFTEAPKPMTEFNLFFYGPFSINGPNSIFMDPVGDESGIYLWAIRSQDRFLVEYVGETGYSFRQRTKEHMIQVLGGNYRSLDPDYYDRGVVRVLWNGLWRKGTQDKLNEFIDAYPVLASKIAQYVKSIHLFVAPLNAPSYERKLIEGGIASYVKAQPEEISRFYPRDNRTYNPKPNEKGILVTIASAAEIMGLPAELRL